VKVLSIVTLDRNAPHTHENPDTPARMAALIAEMRAKGVLLDTGGRANEMLEMQITRKDGGLTVTDGPFAETKEVVGGYALLDVKDRDDAIAWTDRFLSLLGTGTCYLHEVVQAPE
jgi:hypothetical protein